MEGQSGTSEAGAAGGTQDTTPQPDGEVEKVATTSITKRAIATACGRSLPGRSAPFDTASARIVALTLPDDTTLIATKETLTSVPGSPLHEMFADRDLCSTGALPCARGNAFVDANPRLFRLLYDRLRVPAIGWETPAGVDPREWDAEIRRWRVGPHSLHRRGVKRRWSARGEGGDGDDERGVAAVGAEEHVPGDDDGGGVSQVRGARRIASATAQSQLLARWEESVRRWKDWIEDSPVYKDMVRDGLGAMELEFLEGQVVDVAVGGDGGSHAGKWWQNMASHPTTAAVLKRVMGCTGVVVKWNRPGVNKASRDAPVGTRWPASLIKKQRLRSKTGTFSVTLSYY